MAKFTIYNFVAADRTMIAQGASFSWRSYTDTNGVFGNPGAYVLYNDGTKDTRTGRPIGKAFTVDQSHYNLQARDGQKDYDGVFLKDYFLNTPFTEGSPNGDYVDAEGNIVLPHECRSRDENLKKLKSGEWKQLNVKIKLMDSELDAEIALEAGLKRAEAQLSVGQLDEQTLSEIGALVGAFGAPDKIMRHKVYDFAGKKPLDYFKHLNSGDRAVRALNRKGLADGVLKQKGSVVFWEETVLGNDEDAAVATLLGDSKMLDALQTKVSFKVEKKKTKK